MVELKKIFFFFNLAVKANCGLLCKHGGFVGFTVPTGLLCTVLMSHSLELLESFVT